MEKLVVALLAVVIGLALLAGFSALVALPVMWLFNYLAPAFNSAIQLDFCHAWALSLLCGTLVKGGSVQQSK